jgi:hypothetical protein
VPARIGKPCIDATAIARLGIGDSTAIEYRCSRNELRTQRLSRYGEGTFLGHVLLEWTSNGIDYVVSSHGYGQASRVLMEGLAKSTSLVSA